jgi:hypothetical protein
MLNLYFELENYANDHNGWFPKSKKGAFDALQELYPDYCQSGKELVGLSKDIDVTVKRLRAGQPLDEKLTSWVYVQGLKRSDDLNLALVWEDQTGIDLMGRKRKDLAHVVLLLSGEIKLIPITEWTTFLSEQESLRKAAFARDVSEPSKVSNHNLDEKLFHK